MRTRGEMMMTIQGRILRPTARNLARSAPGNARAKAGRLDFDHPHSPQGGHALGHALPAFAQRRGRAFLQCRQRHGRVRRSGALQAGVEARFPAGYRQRYRERRRPR